MRSFWIIAALGLASILGADLASAGNKLPPAAPVLRQLPPPNMAYPVIIPPSAALSRALGAAPGAKALGIKMKGPLYIVKLKQGNTVMQVRVNAATGLIAP